MSHLEAFRAHEAQRKKQVIDLPTRGIVSAVSPDIESVDVNIANQPGQPRMVVRHPYLGVNSWIRVMPDVGTAVLTQRRGDLAKEEIWGYISNTLPKQVHDAKENGAPMRTLRAGEIEIRSSGRASAYFGLNGNMELRGGPLELDLSTTRLEISSQSPTFKRRLMLHDPTALDNMEVFGLVRRPDAKNPQASPALQQFVRITPGGEFAQEYGRFMVRKDGTMLIRKQEGDVVDVAGTIEKHPTTQKPLRLRHIIGHRDKSSQLLLRIDDSLNWQIMNTSTSSSEVDLQLGSATTLKVNTQALNAIFSKTGVMTFNQGLTVKSNQLLLQAPKVVFGNTGSFQAVIGTQLANGILSPLFTALESGLQILAAEPALSAATHIALSGLVATLINLSSGISGILSSQVYLSG